MFKRSIGAACGMLMAVAMAAPGGAGEASAAAVAKPDYQVKLLLKGDAVDAEGQPSQALTSRFELGEFEGTERSVYVDTPDRFYGSRGWSIRLRHKEGADSYDVTFKRRAELADNSLSEDSVDRALEEARDAGFDSSDDNYAAQVNASYASTTLDFSNKKEAGCIDKQCSLPEGDRAVDIAAELEPGKLSKATGTSIAEVGPVASTTVEQKTWRVTIDGIATDLEVSTFAGRHWVEISEEEDSRKDATDKRERLIKALDDAGLLEHRDAFKTAEVIAAS